MKVASTAPLITNISSNALLLLEEWECEDLLITRYSITQVISSATLDAEKFSKYFDDASIFMIPGAV